MELVHTVTVSHVISETAWAMALVAWVYVWYRSVRWYRIANGTLPLARTIVWLCSLQTALTLLAVVLVPFIPARHTWVDWVVLILPAVQLASAFVVWWGGQWMYSDGIKVEVPHSEEP